MLTSIDFHHDFLRIAKLKNKLPEHFNEFLKKQF